MKLKKALLLVVSAMLLMSLTVVGTLAYLTATTNEVRNTFTVGKVHFGDEEDLTDGLDEAKVDEYGVPVTPAERVTSNTYKLMPGHTYTKDPTVTIGEGSEVAYVRMKVTITDLADVKAAFGVAADEYFLPQNFVNGTWDGTIWETTGEVVEEDNAATYEFWYYTTVDAREEAQVLEPLFREIKVPDGIDNTTLDSIKDMEIKVIADAIQADGFLNATAAWKAFDGE